MEHIDVFDTQTHHRALVAAWRRWEENRTSDHRKALGKALHETKAQLAAWLTPSEGARRYANQETRMLADEISAVEAVVTQYDQQKARGY